MVILITAPADAKGSILLRAPIRPAAVDSTFASLASGSWAPRPHAPVARGPLELGLEHAAAFAGREGSLVPDPCAAPALLAPIISPPRP